MNRDSVVELPEGFEQPSAEMIQSIQFESDEILLQSDENGSVDREYVEYAEKKSSSEKNSTNNK